MYGKKKKNQWCIWWKLRKLSIKSDRFLQLFVLRSEKSNLDTVEWLICGPRVYLALDTCIFGDKRSEWDLALFKLKAGVLGAVTIGQGDAGVCWRVLMGTSLTSILDPQPSTSFHLFGWSEGIQEYNFLLVILYDSTGAAELLIDWRYFILASLYVHNSTSHIYQYFDRKMNRPDSCDFWAGLLSCTLTVFGYILFFPVEV